MIVGEEKGEDLVNYDDMKKCGSLPIIYPSDFPNCFPSSDLHSSKLRNGCENRLVFLASVMRIFDKNLICKKGTEVARVCR